MTRCSVRTSALSDLYSDILKAEVAFCFTLVELASLDVQSQDWESAEWILHTAQRQYDSLIRMLAGFRESEFPQERVDVVQIRPLLKRLKIQVRMRAATA